MKKIAQLLLLFSMALLGQNGFAQITSDEYKDSIQLRQFTGEFESVTLPPMEIYIQNNQLMAVLGSQPPLPFVPLDQNIFANQKVGALMELKIRGRSDFILFAKTGWECSRF